MFVERLDQKEYRKTLWVIKQVYLISISAVIK